MEKSRAQIQIDLAHLEKKVRLYKFRCSIHTETMMGFIGGNPMAWMILLLPAFIAGWRAARTRHPFSLIKQIVKKIAFSKLGFI